MRLLEPQRPDALAAVALAGAVGFAGNWLAARIRTSAGRRLDSPALVADGDHARADAYVSLAVIASAAVVALGSRGRRSADRPRHHVRDPADHPAVVADGSLSLDGGDPLAVAVNRRDPLRRAGRARAAAGREPGPCPGLDRRRVRRVALAPARRDGLARAPSQRRRRRRGPRRGRSRRRRPPSRRPAHRDAVALGRQQRRRRGARRPARRRRRHRGARSGDRRRHAARRRDGVRAVEDGSPAGRARGAGDALGGRRARSGRSRRGAVRRRRRADRRTTSRTRSGPPATAAGWTPRGTCSSAARTRNWVGYDDLTPLDAARRSEAHELVDWLRSVGGVSAADLPSRSGS